MNNIRFFPLTKLEYIEIFYPLIIKIFADGLYGSKKIPAKQEATETAMEYFDKLLKKGMDTPDHFFYSIKNGDIRVGFIWFYLKIVKNIIRSRLSLIYTDENFRRKGFAEYAMNMIEKEFIKKGINEIELNVFSNNEIALSLYNKLGYKKDVSQSHSTRFLMVKNII
jgi:ribosomal protein S18 acetylase RimI-like enzyme